MKPDTLKRLESYENFDIDGNIKDIIDFKELKFALRTRNISEGVLMALTNEIMDEDEYTGFWEMMLEDSYTIQEIYEVFEECIDKNMISYLDSKGIKILKEDI